MKLLRVKSRNYKGKQYFKYRVNIPEEDIEKSGFKVGDELNTDIKQGSIKLIKK